MAIVTVADPNYHGSLTIDRDLMDAAGLQPYQKILVANADNASRFETYVIEGERGSGVIGLNGAAALLGKPGDKVIIMSFCYLTAQEVPSHEPAVVHVDNRNRALQVNTCRLLDRMVSAA
jgi:aspartate 1-decarboxylase